MMPKIRTFPHEVALAAFLESHNISAVRTDVFKNNSGGLGVVFEDASADRGLVVYGTDNVTGATAAETTYAAAVTAGDYTAAINVASSTKLLLYFTVVTAAAVTLKFGLRSSNLGAADADTATDWYRVLTDEAGVAAGVRTFSEVEGNVASAQMNVTGGKYLVALDVEHSNWLSLVFWNGGAAEITVVAETL
jgi:hypothetical protein